MANGKPDIYDVKFDIYDVDFDVFEQVPTEDVALDPSPGEVVMLDRNALHEIGAIAIGQDVEPMATNQTPVQDVISSQNSLSDEIAETRQIPVAIENRDAREATKHTTPTREEIPSDIMDTVSSAVDRVLSASDRAFVAYSHIIQESLDGRKLEKQEKKYYDAAIRLDGRLEQFRDDSYMVVAKSDQVMQDYIDGKDPLAPPERIEMLIDLLVRNAQPNKDGAVHHRAILGTLRAQGEFLTSHEQHAFWRKVYEDERVVPLQNGSFMIARQEADEGNPDIMPNDIPEEAQGMSVKEISRAIKETKKSDGWKYARRKERLRNRRPRKFTVKTPHHSTKSKGKTHGKKVSLDNLIEHMNSNRN